MLNDTTFSQNAVNITQGDTMRFANPATGTPQLLCLASHFECTTNSDGPKQLRAPGIIIAPSQTLHIKFSTIGNYQIISPNIPHMILTIRVYEPSSD